MNEAAIFTSGQPSPDSSVVVIGYGPQPFDFLKHAANLCGKDAIISPALARLAGANIAAGRPEAIGELIRRLEQGAITREREAHSSSGLSENAIMWLATGERGLSSETLFTFLTGVDAESDHGHHYPLDPYDLRRCRLLLDQCPELVPNLHKVAEAGPQWAALVARWDELCKVMDEECPEWRTSAIWSTPETYGLMREILAGTKGNV